MLTIQEIERLIAQNKNKLESQFGVERIGVFGSYVRNEQSSTSDLDILVSLKSRISFVTFMKLERHLSNMLDVKVDLVSEKALKPYIGQQIMSEVKYV